jgi:hypothetical protein
MQTPDTRSFTAPTDEAHRELEQGFERIWESLTEEQRRVALSLPLTSPLGENIEYIQEISDLPNLEQVQEALLCLESLGIVEFVQDTEPTAETDMLLVGHDFYRVLIKRKNLKFFSYIVRQHANWKPESHS